MSDLAALAYLESRRFVNAMRGVRRSPSRLILWLLFAVWISFTIFGRLRNVTKLGVSLQDPAGSIVGLGAIVLLAASAINGARGSIGTFNGAADAHFLNMSRLSERTVVLWLQVRSSVMLLLRIGIVIVFYAALYTRSNAPGAAIAMILVGALAMLLPLPSFELARRLGQAPVIALAALAGGSAAICVGIVALAIAMPQLAPYANAVEHLGIGTIVTALWSGNPRDLAVLAAIAIAVPVAGAFDARNLFPELYVASLKSRAHRLRAGTWRQFQKPKSGVTTAASATTMLSGPFTVFWMQRITLMRSPGARLILFGGLALALVGGIAGGMYSRHDPSAFYSILLTSFSVLNILLAISGVSLAQDLGKPIWWMGSGSTFVKLVTWCVGTSLQASLVLLTAVVSAGIAAGEPAATGIAACVAILLPPMVRAIGVVTFSFFPAAIDQRGPLAVIRVFTIYAFFLPIAIVGVIAGVLLNNIPAGIVFGTCTAVAEGLLCLFIAARRIEEHGAEYAGPEALQPA